MISDPTVTVNRNGANTGAVVVSPQQYGRAVTIHEPGLPGIDAKQSINFYAPGPMPTDGLIPFIFLPLTDQITVSAGVAAATVAPKAPLTLSVQRWSGGVLTPFATVSWQAGEFSASVALTPTTFLQGDALYIPPYTGTLTTIANIGMGFS